ncbi:ATP-binding protein [Ottowia pentelensis]|uniref:ATP-binding protein n=1 Tax=Ottowia pentelensis TaxID=511108 RepID=A0ABV6PV72_9BURK
MITLAEYLANQVRALAHERLGASASSQETRVVFRGPPLEILDPVFELLVPSGSGGDDLGLPVLLQVPKSKLVDQNPPVGASGRCDHGHLLTVRNTPAAPSFLALVPPGQQMDLSVSTTTEAIGVSALASRGMATFEEWWGDSFVQRIVTDGIGNLGVSSDAGGVRMLVEAAARAADELDQDRSSRAGAWRVFARLFAASRPWGKESAIVRVCAACGVPPVEGHEIQADLQRKALACLASALEDGFKAGLDRATENAGDQATRDALLQFDEFIRQACDIASAFGRAPAAYYSTSLGPTLAPPPDWWHLLTAERWIELLEESRPEKPSLEIEVLNALTPIRVGGVFIVSSQADVRVSHPAATESIDIVLERKVGNSARGKDSRGLTLGTSGVDCTFDIPKHKAPARVVALVEGTQAASAKVLAIESWDPGIHIQARTASKISLAKRPTKPAVGRPAIETTIELDGPGRHLLDVFTASWLQLSPKATLFSKDAAGLDGELQLDVRQVARGRFTVEVEASSECSLKLELERIVAGRAVHESCLVNLPSVDVRITGCASEFERLVGENRLKKRALVQVDRVARCAVLESWILEEPTCSDSWRPIVLGPDYALVWSRLEWSSERGPLVSKGRFVSDPRPARDELNPPQAYIDARRAILARVRGVDNAGLTAQAALGQWHRDDPTFREEVAAFLDAYLAWWINDRDAACWSDIVGIASYEASAKTLSSTLDAILLSPLHPLRLAWHCGAQEVLLSALDSAMPCPAAALLDPDFVPDFLSLAVRGPDGIEQHAFVAVECSSDYWSVMWNSRALSAINARARQEPFGNEFGLTVGGLAKGFSPAQVGKALDDVASLLPAKPLLSISLSSSGAAVDSCNAGISEWSRRNFGEDSETGDSAFNRLGLRLIEVHDNRPEDARPDEPSLANLVEDTKASVRWYLQSKRTSGVDLAIITQLDASQPTLTPSVERSALSAGALIRHRVRRQLPQAGQAYLVESRQSAPPESSVEGLLQKVGNAVASIEAATAETLGFRFVPDVGAIKSALDDDGADFVAVSSSAVDPSCFVGEWLTGAYLWDYSLPSYSQRSGDVAGSYLISSIKDADREVLAKVVSQLMSDDTWEPARLEGLLHEVARRGIPTVRELSGDDTKASGALGMFIAARILQDNFRLGGGPGGLIPVTEGGSADEASIALLVPVDPFRTHLDDLSRDVRKGKDLSGRRPDLLLATFTFNATGTAIRLIPIEVKFRSSGQMSREDCKAALEQASTFAAIFDAIAERARSSLMWELALNQLVLSMMAFSMRIYSQNKSIAQDGKEWARLHERLARALLGGSASLEVDPRGRLIVIDGSPNTGPADRDGDGFEESIVVSLQDAARILSGDGEPLYAAMRARLGAWETKPAPKAATTATTPSPISGPTDEGESNADSTPPSGVSQPRGEDLGLGQTTSTLDRDDPANTDATALSQSGAAHAAAAGGGIILELGTTASRFEQVTVALNLSDTRLNQLNMGVVGDLGTGKTQLLKSLILQITRATAANRSIKPRVLIFDYKKDYSSPEFIQAVGAKVVKPYRMPLNLFDTSGMEDAAVPWLERFKFFSDVLEKIYPGIGPVQRDKLKQAVRRAYEVAGAMSRMPTLADVEAEYRSLLGGKSDAPLSIIGDLVDSEVFTREPATGASFKDFFDGVVVISLAAMGQDDRSKNMVVAIMLNMFYEHMLSLTKRPFIGSDPQLRAIDSYLLVDEADNIMQYEFDVLRKLLLQGREFGVGVILASQYLRHFKVNATDYRDPLLTWFVHKVPNVTASELSGLGLTSDLGEFAERIKSLPNHHCMFKSHGPGAEIIRGLPFFEIVTRTDG